MAGPGQPKTGGRKAGTPNKRKASFDAALAETGLDPKRLTVLYAQNAVPCTTCDEDGFVTRLHFYLGVGVQSAKLLIAAGLDEDAVMPCHRCAGTGIRDLDDEVVLKALLTIIATQVPKLSAIRLSGDEDGMPVMISLNHSADDAKSSFLRKFMAYAEQKRKEAEGADKDPN